MRFTSIAGGLKRVLNKLDVWRLGIHLNRHDIEAAEFVCLLPLNEIGL